MNIKRLLPVALGVAGLVAAFATPSRAALAEPCESAAAASISLSPIKAGGQIYCQSAYGWSDSWFPTSQPTTYDQTKDAFSGDNAPGVSYTYNNAGTTTTVHSGNKYDLISPFLDGTKLNAQSIGSNWQVKNDIVVNGNVATSTIYLPNPNAPQSPAGLYLTVTTTVFTGGLTEAFQFTNNNTYDITDLLFSDFFRFHPDGSLGAGASCGTTSVSGGTVTSVAGTGSGCTPIVKNGTMSGSKDPLKWDLGLSADVLNDMANGTYNDATAPVTGDTAADFVWDLGPLGQGQTVNFTITKRVNVPEPGSFALLASGLLMLGLVRRRRQTAKI